MLAWRCCCRAAAEADQRADLLPKLRDVSRQTYLAKREEKKLQELADELEVSLGGVLGALAVLCPVYLC